MGYTVKPYSRGTFDPDVCIDEFERLRRLVPKRPDWHLHNWGLWVRGEKVTDGFDEESCGFVGGGYFWDFDEECERNYAAIAAINDTILTDMQQDPRWQNEFTAIQIVYANSTFRFNRLSIEELLIAGAEEFWRRARARGLQ